MQRGQHEQSVRDHAWTSSRSRKETGSLEPSARTCARTSCSAGLTNKDEADLGQLSAPSAAAQEMWWPSRGGSSPLSRQQEPARDTELLADAVAAADRMSASGSSRGTASPRRQA